MALLARAALPLGLLATGAALAFDGLRRRIGAILMASTAKFAVLPGLVWAGLRLTGITGADAGALLLFAVAPASISAYVLARQSGGDHRLMTGIITFQTVAAGAVLPIWLGAVGAL
jgi:predicted permease